MAYQVSDASAIPNQIAAHNLTHKSVAAMEIAAATKPHYDGSEVTTAAVEQVLSSFYSSPTTFADAVSVVEKAINLWDTQHSNRHNTGGTAGVYAHKATGTLVGGSVGASGSSLEADMIAAWGAIAIAQLTALRGHMLNTGGTWHGTADLFNVVSIPASITTKKQLFEAVLLLRAVHMDHIASSSGGAPHSSADTTNTIAAAPPDTEDDWDAMKAVLTEVATDLPAHAADSGIHNSAQSITLTAPSYPTAVSTAFTRVNTYKSTHNTDLGSTVIHESADSTNTLSSSNATTVATYMTLAQEIYTDQTAHFRFAPTSRALRSVAP